MTREAGTEPEASSSADTGASHEAGNVRHDGAVSDSGSCSLELGDYSGSNWPPACVAFYSPTSFWNTPIPESPTLDPNSAAILGFYSSNYNGFVLGSLNVGDPNSTNDFGHPLYFSRASDPLFTLHCLNNAVWGTCPIEGKEIRIPDGAQPAGGGDGHMGIVNQTDGVEYDMWQTKRAAIDGGQLDCTYGGLGPFSGPGFTAGSATASNANLGAGLIRSEELIAGKIDHVLFGVIACCNGHAVGVSESFGGHCDTECTDGQGGAVGQVYRLNMSDSQMDALGKSQAATAILKAMAHYGIVDGDENAYGFGLNAVVPSVSRTSLGDTDPIIAWAQAEGLPSDGNGGYVLDYGSGIDWPTALVVLAPPP